jgi:predicted nucleic acid-binding protein
MWLLDTNILIAFFDASSSHHELAKALFSSLESGTFNGAIAAQNILELSSVLIGGYKATRASVAFHIQSLVSIKNISVIYPNTATIILYITLLKQEKGIHTTDLFLAATMLSHNISSIITNDRDFEKISTITIYNPFHPTSLSKK